MDDSVSIIKEINPEDMNHELITLEDSEIQVIPTPKKTPKSLKKIVPVKQRITPKSIKKKSCTRRNPLVMKNALDEDNSVVFEKQVKTPVSKTQKSSINRGVKRKLSTVTTFKGKPTTPGRKPKKLKTPVKQKRSYPGGSSFQGDDDIEIIFEWDPAAVISERQGVSEWQAKNVISLFDKDNTLPFIARYRKEKTGNLEVEKLREIQSAYTQLRLVREKVQKAITGENSVKIEDDHKKSLLQATSLQEVKQLLEPLKSKGKKTHAEKARELGLEDVAKDIFYDTANNVKCKMDHKRYINSEIEGLSSVEEIEQGIQYIIADMINKDLDVMNYVKNLIRTSRITIECNKKKVVKSTIKKQPPNDAVVAKFERYFNFCQPASYCRPHQMLAINRGEKQNVLSVKVNVSNGCRTDFIRFCTDKYSLYDQKIYRNQVIIASTEDAYERLVKPFIQRQIRNQLTEKAELASVDVFTSNLKKLLMTHPVRGKTVLAVDPGYRNGCKIGVTNLQGELLLTTTIYPFKASKEVSLDNDHNAKTLAEIVHKHGVELIAIGNGTACRQMEEYLSNLIKAGIFKPLNVQYTIINESGVSVYSCTPEAKAELPGMDPCHISAVSLARRLQDPLLEYVKVPPISLGIGMYQHDVPEKLLASSLESVMVECVSFVGVDINVASEFILRKVSGLSKLRAKNIVEYRKTTGAFVNRQQLRKVKGLGPKSFEQCAGFVRILPETLEKTIKKENKDKVSVNPLDRTLVHPESYDVAEKLMTLAKVDSAQIGTSDFITNLTNFTKTSSLEELAKKCSSTIPTLQLIIEGLSLPTEFDIRAQFEKPLFRKGVMSISELNPGLILQGAVTNVTHFGAFVDIGVGNDALIHTSKMNRLRVELGNKVEVKILTVDVHKKHIGLDLMRVF